MSLCVLLQQTALISCNRDVAFSVTYKLNIIQKFKLRKVKIRCGVRFYSHSFPDAAQISQNKWKCHVFRLVVNISGVCFVTTFCSPGNTVRLIWWPLCSELLAMTLNSAGSIILCLKKQLNNGSPWKLFNPALTLAYKMTGLRYSRDLWWRMFRIRFSISKWRFSNLTSGWALILYTT